MMTLNDQWHAEDTCRVGSDVRLAKTEEGAWIVIQRGAGILIQAFHPFPAFRDALDATQGMALKDDRDSVEPR